MYPGGADGDSMPTSLYETILVATDGTETTGAAVAHALELAERHDAAVHALSVVDSRSIALDDDEFVSDGAVLEALTDSAERAAAEVVRRAEDRGLAAHAAVERGTPVRVIRQYAAEHDVDLVAMGTRGRRGLTRYVLGSVAQGVIQTADQPVLTARPRVAPPADGYDRILVPTDGGEHAARVTAHAVALAERYDATVHALSVVDAGVVRSPVLIGALEREAETALEAVERAAGEAGVGVRTRVWRGSPADCITRYVADHDVDLLAMGTHERRGLDRFLTQTVAERVVRRVDCPVITLRERGRDRDGDGDDGAEAGDGPETDAGDADATHEGA